MASSVADVELRSSGWNFAPHGPSRESAWLGWSSARDVSDPCRATKYMFDFTTSAYSNSSLSICTRKSI